MFRKICSPWLYHISYIHCVRYQRLCFLSSNPQEELEQHFAQVQSQPEILSSWLHVRHVRSMENEWLKPNWLLMVQKSPTTTGWMYKTLWKKWDILPTSTGEFTGFLNHQQDHPRKTGKNHHLPKLHFDVGFKRCVNQSLSLVGLSNPTSCKGEKTIIFQAVIFQPVEVGSAWISYIYDATLQWCSTHRSSNCWRSVTWSFLHETWKDDDSDIFTSPESYGQFLGRIHSVFKMFETPRPWKSPSFLGDTIKMKKKQPATVVYRRLYLSFRFIFKWMEEGLEGCWVVIWAGVESGKEAIGRYSYGDFLKCWYPTTMGFLLKMIILRRFGGTTI